MNLYNLRQQNENKFNRMLQYYTSETVLIWTCLKHFQNHDRWFSTHRYRGIENIKL